MCERIDTRIINGAVQISIISARAIEWKQKVSTVRLQPSIIVEQPVFCIIAIYSAKDIDHG